MRSRSSPSGPGQVTGTIVPNFDTPIANNASDARTVAVDGVVDGDCVSLGLTSLGLTDGLIVLGAASGTGNVTVFLLNKTGGPVTPGALTLRFTATGTTP